MISTTMMNRHHPHFKTDTAVLYYERTFYIGAFYLRIGNIQASQAQFLETLKTPKRNTTYFNALINLGQTYCAEKHFKHAIELYEEALSTAESSSLPAEDAVKVKTLALFSLANAYSDTGDELKSRAHFQQALESSSLNQRPAIMLALYQRLFERGDKESLLEQCIDLITSNNLHPDASQSGGSLGLTTSLFLSLLRESYLLSRPLFDRLFAFASTLALTKEQGPDWADGSWGMG